MLSSYRATQIIYSYCWLRLVWFFEELVHSVSFIEFKCKELFLEFLYFHFAVRAAVVASVHSLLLFSQNQPLVSSTCLFVSLFSVSLVSTLIFTVSFLLFALGVFCSSFVGSCGLNSDH